MVILIYFFPCLVFNLILVFSLIYCNMCTRSQFPEPFCFAEFSFFFFNYCNFTLIRRGSEVAVLLSSISFFFFLGLEGRGCYSRVN